MKTTILILLFPVLLCSQSIPAVIEFPAGSTYDQLQHDTLVRRAFMLGYGSEKELYSIKGDINQAAFDSARAHKCNLIICSRIGAISLINLAAQNRDIGLIMPTGSNEYVRVYTGELPDILLTGAGDDTLQTAYPVDLFYIDPIDSINHSSFSNGYAAGVIAYLMDYGRCSFWKARIITRLTAGNGGIRNEKSGFGKISKERAKEYIDKLNAGTFSNRKIKPLIK